MSRQQTPLAAMLLIGVSLVPALPLAAQNLVTLASVGAGDRQLGTITVATGTMTLAGSPINGAPLSTASGVNSYDPSGNRLLFVGTPAGSPLLYAINAQTGAVLSSPALSGGSTTLQGLEWDDGEGVLYALASVSGDRQVGSVVPATGVVTLLGSPIAGANLSSVSGGDDLDPVGNRYFFAGTPSGGNLKIYSISTVNGAVLNNPDLGGAAINALLGLEYDSGEGVLYGLASVGAGDRQVAAINPATGVLTLLGAPIAGASLSTTSGADTLDESGNRYLFTGTPSGGNPKIYAINTANGAVLTNPDLNGAAVNALQGLEWDSGTLPVELSGVTVE